MDRPSVEPGLLLDLHTVNHRHWTRMATFAVLYVTAGWAAYQLAEAFPGDTVALLVRLPLYLLAAAALHGISLFTHEGVHGTISRNAHVNRLVSVLCALPVGQNFAAYKVLHLNHHNHLGREGDPDHYPNYTRWTWLQLTLYWGRLIVGYPVYLTAIPILGFRQGNRSERAWIVFEAALLGLLVAAVLLSAVPRALLFHGWLVPMLVINTLVNIRGMSQHTLLEDAADPIRGTRSILTNPVTRFFMCNENYHLEHHLYPGVPWYNLPRLHHALRDDLAARGAPFIRSYAAFVRDFAVASWRCSPLGRRLAGRW